MPLKKVTQILGTALASLLLLVAPAYAVTTVSQGGTGASSFSYGLIGSPGGLSPFVNFATSTLYGTGVSGQVLMWSNGMPVWAATSTGGGGTTYTAFTPLSINGDNVISIATSSASQSGFISAADYQLLHTPTTTFSGPLVYTGSTNAVTCPTCTTGGVTSVSGTPNQITSSGGTTPTLSLPSLVVFPGNASTTQFTATSNVFVTALTNKLLATDQNGMMVGTTSVGTNYITGLLGTINGTPFNRGGSITVSAASSTLLGDNNTFSGLNTFTNVGTTSFTGGVSANRLNWTATSTGSFGINLTGGCFSINDTCLTSGSATSPGGSDKQIQFNNAGSFGGALLEYSVPTAGTAQVATPDGDAIHLQTTGSGNTALVNVAANGTLDFTSTDGSHTGELAIGPTSWFASNPINSRYTFENGGGFNGILDFASLTGDRVFTFPNTAGTLCIVGVACDGSGTVNSGSANQVAYYAANGTAVSGTSTLTFSPSGAANNLFFGDSSFTNSAAELSYDDSGNSASLYLQGKGDHADITLNAKQSLGAYLLMVNNDTSKQVDLETNSTSTFPFAVQATCFTLNGSTCLTTGGSSASSTLLADNNTFTGTNQFLASTTIGNGTVSGGLTVNGPATTTGNMNIGGITYFGNDTFIPADHYFNVGSAKMYYNSTFKNVAFLNDVTGGGLQFQAQSYIQFQRTSDFASLLSLYPANRIALFDGLGNETNGVLQINGTTTAAGALRYTQLQQTTGGYLDFTGQDANVKGVTFSSGNVGIATSTPGSLLSVQNVANFTTATSTIYSGFAVTGRSAFTGLSNAITNASTTHFTAATSLQIPNGSSQTPTAAGYIAQDTTNNQIVFGKAGTTGVLDERRAITLAYATTTTWTGTTTVGYQIVFPYASTITGGYCTVLPAAATVNAQLIYANPTAFTTVNVPMIPASTTPGLWAIGSNNTPTAGATSTLQFGTPASSPTSASCTFLYTVTAT